MLTQPPLALPKEYWALWRRAASVGFDLVYEIERADLPAGGLDIPVLRLVRDGKVWGVSLVGQEEYLTGFVDGYRRCFRDTERRLQAEKPAEPAPVQTDG